MNYMQIPAAAALECIEANLVNCFFTLNASFCVIEIQREQIASCYRVTVSMQGKVH